MQTVYYCVQGASSIYKCFLEYKKIQELSKLNNELERHKHITEALTSYSKLIRNDVKELMHMFFKSACENLNYALNSDGEGRNNYILAAKSRFIDAIAVEKNENLILSYLGLALCQIAHGEADNCIMTLHRIQSVYCVLPDDWEELHSMMRYKFLPTPEMTCDELLDGPIIKYYDSLVKRQQCCPFFCKWGSERNEYYWRLVTVLHTNGFFHLYHTALTTYSFDIKQGEKVLIKSMQQILHEDFDALKTEVINNIQIYEQIR